MKSESRPEVIANLDKIKYKTSLCKSDSRRAMVNLVLIYDMSVTSRRFIVEHLHQLPPPHATAKRCVLCTQGEITWGIVLYDIHTSYHGCIYANIQES